MALEDYMNTRAWLATSGQGTVSTSDTLPSVDDAIYDKELLERAMPLLVHADFGQQKSIGRNQGMSILFRRYESLGQALAPLQDGVTPTGTTLTKTDYVATLTQHGNWTAITDNVDFFNVDPVLMEASKLMGENMGESIDSIIRDTLVAGTSVYRVVVDDAGTVDISGTLRSQVYGSLCKTVIDAVIRDLKAANAKPFEPAIQGSAKIGTHPIGEAFWCVTTTEAEHDFYKTAGGFWDATYKILHGFIPVQNYSGTTGVRKGEYGSYRNCRFIGTTNAKCWAGEGGTGTGKQETSSNADVYAALFFGRDAYGVVKPSGMGAGIIKMPPTDPLKQRSTVGWKGWVATKILKQDWMCRIEHAILE